MKSILKNLGWCFLELIVFAIIFLAIFSIFYFGFQWMSTGQMHVGKNFDFNELTSPFRILFSNFLPILISGVAASILTHYYIFNKPFYDLGYSARPLGYQFGQGWLWSLALILPGFLFLLVFQQIELLATTWNAGYFFGFILLFIIQSAGEEVLTRSFLINLIEPRFGTLLAVILSASIFSIMHLGNDHFSWIGFINILLGGALMALFFILYRSIWICTGLHAGWNFIQAGLLDFNVSGLDVYSFIQFKLTGYPRLTGADFGYEGSLVAIVFQLLGLYFFIKWNKPALEKIIFPEPVQPVIIENEVIVSPPAMPQNES